VEGRKMFQGGVAWEGVLSVFSLQAAFPILPAP
jgi:hypothetical protein